MSNLVGMNCIAPSAFMRAIVIFISLGTAVPQGIAVSSEEVIHGIASWYDHDSVRREGTCLAEKCYTASGKEIHALEKGHALFCASNDYPLGTRLVVARKGGEKKITVLVLDRGRFNRLGRKLDLCKEAFEKLAPLEEGLIEVSITKIK